MGHAWFFFCLICGQRFLKQLNEVLHKELDEILIHKEQITECPTCNQLCTSVEYAGLQITPLSYVEIENPVEDIYDDGITTDAEAADMI